MKLQRLRGRKTCDRVRKKGNVFKGKTMVIRWSGVPRGPEYSEGLYVGTYAPTSLHTSAVKRNRMRRRCREALRVVAREMDGIEHMQVLLCPLRASRTCDFADIMADVKRFLRYHSCDESR